MSARYKNVGFPATVGQGRVRSPASSMACKNRRFGGRALIRLLRDRQGTAALEFAIIAPIFFALLFSFYDMGLMMLRQVLLQSAVEKSVRTLRVDLARLQPNEPSREIDRDVFKKEVCDRAMILRNCVDTITIEMTSLGRYAATPPAPGSPCKASSSSTMQVGARNDIVLLRVCAVANPIIPMMGLGSAFVEDADGDVRIITTTAYLNE